MKAKTYLPGWLLLACAWPLQAQQTTVNLTVVHLDPGMQLTPFEQTILDKEKEVLDLSIKRDFGGWEGLVSDDALAVYSDGYATKADVLQAIKTGTDVHCAMDKLKFNVISKDAGLITYRMTQDWKEAGKKQARQYYVSSLWVNRGGRWISSFWQETDTSPQPQFAKDKAAETNAAYSTAPDELKKLENEAVQAQLHADLAAIDRIFADDWVIVDEEAQVRDKKAEFDPYKTGEEKVTAARLDDLDVRVFGDAGIVTGRYMFKGSFQGKPFDIKGRFSDVCIKRNGLWQIAYSQNTASPEAESTEFPPDSFFIAKEKEVWEALKHKDKAAATRLLADDFVGMYDFGFFNKTEWVKQIDDQYTVDDYAISDAKVLHPSPSTALLLYTGTCKGTGAWADYCSHTSRISDMWVERNGYWQGLFSQDVRAAGTDQDDASVLKEILASEYRIVAALSRDDIEGFAKLLPEDVIDIDDDGIHTKAEWIPELQAQKDQGLLFRDFRFDDPKLIRLGPDQATFTAKEIIHGIENGKPVEWRYYTNATYVRRDGKWWPRVYQDTPMMK